MKYKTPKHHRRSIQVENYEYSLPDGILIINERRGEVTSPLRNLTLGHIIAYFKYQQ